MSAPQWLRPAWPAPERVRAVQTLRGGGVSEGSFASLNLAEHSGDSTANVAENRRRLAVDAGLPGEPAWLTQVHGCDVIDDASSGTCADAALTRQPGRVRAVMTADCLPLLLCDRAGSVVAVAHAGWRGLAHGVIERAVASLGVSCDEILVWLGPAIGPNAFEVGEDVHAALVDSDPHAEAAFQPAAPGKYLADLYYLACRRLDLAGVRHIYGGGCCTYRDRERFFSYRRDRRCGRMATLIWLAG